MKCPYNLSEKTKIVQIKQEFADDSDNVTDVQQVTHYTYKQADCQHERCGAWDPYNGRCRYVGRRD